MYKLCINGNEVLASLNVDFQIASFGVFWQTFNRLNEISSKPEHARVICNLIKYKRKPQCITTKLVLVKQTTLHLLINYNQQNKPCRALKFFLNFVYFTDLPKFAERLHNITVPLGRDAMLVCIVDNLQTYKVCKKKCLANFIFVRFGHTWNNLTSCSWLLNKPMNSLYHNEVCYVANFLLFLGVSNTFMTA